MRSSRPRVSWSDFGKLKADKQTVLDPQLSPWLKVSSLFQSCVVKADRIAGAEFAEFILQAAFNGKSSTVQAYVHLSAESGGEAIKKEIGTDLDYFSVNVQLGVSSPSPFVVDAS
jgi:hypothetical protein